MSKFLFCLLLLSFTVFISSCSSVDSNANTNTAGVGNVAVDANNLPEGLSTTPIQPSGNSTPGIPDPANANKLPVGGTPTPGIPDPANLRKPFKPGATPTPGIPSPEEMRRQMQRNNSNVSGETMMKKSTPKPQ
jgi:hypothetical protein